MTDAVEAKVLNRFHWWTLEELRRTNEQLTPLSLARIVDEYLAQGPPREPLQVEILDDLGRGRFAPPLPLGDSPQRAKP
jgi:hypothetical protein